MGTCKPEGISQGSSDCPAGIKDDLQRALSTAQEVYNFCIANLRVLWPLTLLTLVCNALPLGLALLLPALTYTAFPLGAFGGAFGTAYACHVLENPDTTIKEACQAMLLPTRKLTLLAVKLMGATLALCLIILIYSIPLALLYGLVVTPSQNVTVMVISTVVVFILVIAAAVAITHVSLGFMLAPCMAYAEDVTPLSSSWHAASGQRLFMLFSSFFVQLPPTLVLLAIIALSGMVVAVQYLNLEVVLLSCLLAPLSFAVPPMVHKKPSPQAYSALV